MKKITLALTTTFCFISLLVQAQPGSLDISFGENGKVLTNFQNSSRCYAAALQQDGKIVTAGPGSNDTASGFLVVRFLPTGAVDASFGNEGRVVTDFNDDICIAQSIAIQQDGKILVTGHGVTGMFGTFYHIYLARYLPNGDLDASFGEGGKVISDFGEDNYSFDLSIQDDGKIVIAGTHRYQQFLIARYLSNGSLDESFGEGGKVFSFNGSTNARTILLQPDGKIIAGGSSDGRQFLIARYLTNGTLDASFGNGGKVYTNFGPGSKFDNINDMALQPDGKIVVTGITNADFFTEDMSTVRYLSNGTVDSAFGIDGKVTTVFESNSTAQGVVIQKNGKICIAGRVFDPAAEISDFGLVRYTSDGTLDSSFGVDGKQITDFIFYDVAWALLETKEGKLLAAGTSNLMDIAPHQISLSRYHGDEEEKTKYVKIKKWLHRHGITWEDKPDNLISYYSVQKSTNGNPFTEVAHIFSKHNGAIQTYEATDNAIANYRVAAVSSNGSITYSNTLTLSNSTLTIKLYPNPAKNNLQIEGLPAGAKTKLTVTDLSGNARITATANSTVYSLNIAQLTKGSYLLKIQTAEEIITKSFIKE